MYKIFYYNNNEDVNVGLLMRNVIPPWNKWRN